MNRTLTDLRALSRRHHLIRIWLRYRIRVRYTQTFLGIGWVMVLPLLSSVVYAFAFGEILGAKNYVSVPYVPFLLCGQILFTVFGSMILGCRSAYLDIMGLANQIYFPREIVLLLMLGELLVDFFFAFIATLVIDGLYGIYPTAAFLLLPLPLLVLCVWSLGLALFVSWWSVRIRDFQPLIGVLMQLLFFLVPVIYGVDQIPQQYRWILYINPLTPIIQTFRALVVGTGSPGWSDLAISAVAGLVVLALGYGYFKRHEKRIMDYQ